MKKFKPFEIAMNLNEDSPYKYNVDYQLLKNRIVYLGTEVNDYTAQSVIAKLLLLEAENPEKDVHLYINSPGGSVSAGLGIYDIMQLISCDVNTYCTGMAASMGSLLLCGGSSGKRFILPNARVMIHQPLGGFQGQASDIERHANEIMRIKKQLYEIYVQHTAKPFEQIEKDCDRDSFLSATEAQAYGLVDHVVEPRHAKAK